MAEENKVPRHVAIIMDGNGRWGERCGKRRTDGHKAGAKRAQEIIKTAAEADVKYLTLYAFSTENWKRLGYEIEVIMKLLRNFSTLKQANALRRAGISVKFIGDHVRLDRTLQTAMKIMEKNTMTGNRMHLQVAISYGGQDEIVRAVNRLTCSPKDVTAVDIADCLDTKGVPDVDLVIRTGGYHRLSNFMLWQTAYAELRFVDTLWPDYSSEHLLDDLVWYQAQQRNFGEVKVAAE